MPLKAALPAGAAGRPAKSLQPIMACFLTHLGMALRS